jgi:hypothetical protein
MKNNSIFLFLGLLLSAGLGFGSLTSCQKMERPDLIIIPDDTARLNGPLQRFFAFENSAIDSIHDTKGNVSGGVSFVNGVRGLAYKGADNGHIEYPSAGKLAEMESFTVAFWMNAPKHKEGAQVLFTMPNTEDFWGNMFVLVESNSSETDNTMQLKFNFAGNWIDFGGRGGTGLQRLPDMYDKWRHLAFSYDAKTSKFAAYLDGEKINLPANVSDRQKDGAPLGAVKFQNVSKFVIGGFQQHIGIKAPAADWMKRYTGMLDQFRVYTKALTDAEVNALFVNKK